MPNIDRAAIAAEVRAELARQRKTQREVGELLHLPKQSVQIRLAGDRSFRVEELATLARWLDVPLDRFIPEADAA